MFKDFSELWDDLKIENITRFLSVWKNFFNLALPCNMNLLCL